MWATMFGSGELRGKAALVSLLGWATGKTFGELLRLSGFFLGWVKAPFIFPVGTELGLHNPCEGKGPVLHSLAGAREERQASKVLTKQS